MSDPSLPLFSVVIPVYNRADVVGRAVESVLAQTCQDFEIIVVDDGSTDDLAGALAEFSDSRIRLIRQDNKGGGAARNAGILAAHGAFIAFLDSDDWFCSEKLAVMAQEIQDHPDFDAYFSYSFVDRGQGIFAIKPSRPLAPDEPIDEYLFCSREVIPTTTLVVRRETRERILFKSGLKKGQDVDYVLRLYRAGCRFFFVPRPLVTWVDTTHGNRVSHTHQALALEAWLEENRPFLSSKSYYGYRATVLSYELSYLKPFTVLRDLLWGVVFGGVCPRVFFHAAFRAYLPQPIYRRLVNIVLKFFVWPRLPVLPGRSP